MTEYTIYFTGFASTWETVEADSPEEAIEKAAPYWGICHQCQKDGDIGDDWEPMVVYEDKSGETAWERS